MFPHFKTVALRRLSTRLVVATVAVIVATAVVAGVPAFLLVRARLEQQAWERVSDGGRVTLALFAAEQARLADLAVLTAQRPTLRHLLEQDELEDLDTYLETFQAGADIDLLVVRDGAGRYLAAGSSLAGVLDVPAVQQAACRVLASTPPQPVLLASAPILTSDGGEELGTVTVGRLLDDAFTRQMAESTGLGQSVVLAGRRLASSLPAAAPQPAAAALEQVAASGQPQVAAIRGRDARYYTVLLPLCDGGTGTALLAEIALPVDRLVATRQQALTGLVASTLLVAAVISVLGVLYARRLTAPLGQLTAAAHNISRGDLTTPVPIPADPEEISLLARALEESRISTRYALDELSQAKAWSETLIQSVVEGIVTCDVGGNITFFSQGAERITGWSSAEVLGRSLNSVFRLLDGSDGPFLGFLPPVGGKRQVSIFTRTGRPITLAVTSAQLAPPAWSATRLALVLRDITEEEAIQHLRSYFLANISHEFRTPLSALKASVELLLDEADTLAESEATELLGSIHRSVTGLQTLIDNLLESARIEAGRFTINRRPTDLSEIVADAVDVVQPLLTRRQQHLNVDEPPRLPPVNVDPTRLTQVLVNLLSNASKYGPIGEEIDLSLSCPDNHLLRVEVADRGPGIPPAERANLFQRFLRLGSHDGTQYGVGLGLSVVKAIVNEHGGEVGVDERPGGGSIFWFTIPLTGGAL